MVSGMFGFYTAGPHTALISSDGKIAIGGRLFALPIVQRVDSLSLTLRTVMVTTAHGTTVNGVAVHVTGCCQVKIRAWTAMADGDDHRMVIDEEAVRLAAQHFLGHSESDMADAIRKTVEGHQRAIIGTLTIEQLYSDRNAFSLRVKELCTDDMRNMGLAMVSYTVAEISDDQGYIDALGVRQTEKVKREAMEGAAFHENLAISKSREMQAESHVKVNRERQRIIQSDKTVQVVRATAQTTIDQAVATQQKAGPIEDAEQNAILRVAKRDAEAARVQAEREVEAINVEKQRLKNEITRNVPADAGLFRKERRAEATRATAQAEALRIRYIAEAEAEAIRAKGEAKTLVLGERIQMWNECGNPAAVMEKLIDALPEVAVQITAPLAKTEKLVFVGGADGDHADGPEVSEASTGGKEAPQALEGMDFERIIRDMMTGVDSTGLAAAMKESMAKKVLSKVAGKMAVPK